MTDRISEIIVVEGRDDTNSIRRAVEADTIETHGFGISGKTWQLLEEAHKVRGLIIFTDPDFAGEQIRRRLTERFPDSKQAHLTQEEARDGEDIGIENAAPEAIREALKRAKARTEEAEDRFSMTDLREAGLAGCSGAGRRREEVGAALGIGYGNSAAFLRKLKAFGISREAFWDAVRKSNA